MALTKEDLQAIKGLITDNNKVIKGDLDSLRIEVLNEINDFREEVVEDLYKLKNDMDYKFKMVVTEISKEVDEKLSKLVHTNNHEARIKTLETDSKVIKKLIIKD